MNFWNVKRGDLEYEASASKVAKQERQVRLLRRELDDDDFDPERRVRNFES